MVKSAAMHESERALIRQIRAGDREAFEDLTQLYIKRAFSTALRFTRNEADAKDMVQEAFVKAYVNLHTYDEHYGFASWFFKILVNSCLNFLKREKRRRLLFDSWKRTPDADFERLEERHASESLNPEDVYLQNERTEAIMRALDRLPEKQRLAIVLYDLEGFSQQEVAGILECPLGSVMSRIYYGRRKLAQYLRGL